MRVADLRQTFGVRLRAARLSRGLTQQQLAERAEVSPELVSRIERGSVLPSLPTFVRLLDSLDLSADAALGRDSRRRGTELADWSALGDALPKEVRAIVSRLGDWVARYEPVKPRRRRAPSKRRMPE